MLTTIEHNDLLVLIASLFGLLMAIGIGANDVSNAMGTSVGSKAITVKQAIVIAILFEFAGSYLAGGEVTQTIRNGIIDVSYFSEQPMVLVYGMMSSLLAAGIWLIIASWAGWPVSTTHSIIGAIIGFTCVSAGPQAVAWGVVKGVVSSWILTPFIAGLISYVIFFSTQKLIFDTDSPFSNAKKYGPAYIFMTVLVMSMVTLAKGLKHIGLQWSLAQSATISISLSLLAAGAGYFVIKRTCKKRNKTKHLFSDVEQVFSRLMLITACAMAFAHGSNDVANAIGPLSAITVILRDGGMSSPTSPVDSWVLALGGAGIVLGLIILGRRVMETVGTGITDLTPSRGFAAEFAAASTVVLASGTGFPISTTQTLVGAVLGVGVARGIAALNLSVVRNIVVSWIVTLPVAALLSVLFFLILSANFS